jgi:hypothetical protein
LEDGEMSNDHHYSIAAIRADGKATELKVHAPMGGDDWGLGASVTMEDGRPLNVIDRGLYQAVGSGDYYRSDDPKAP